MSRLGSPILRSHSGRAVILCLLLLTAFVSLAVWMVARNDSHRRPEEGPKQPANGKGGLETGQAFAGKKTPSGAVIEPSHTIASLISTLAKKLESRVYAEELIPLLIELEDLTAKDDSDSDLRAFVARLVRDDKTPVQIRAMAAIILTASAQGFQPAMALGCLRQDARLDPVLIAAIMIAPGRVSDSLEKRRAFWRGMFMSSDFETAFMTGYERDYFVRKYGKSLQEGGGALASFDEYWDIIAGMTEYVRQRCIGSEEPALRSTLLAYVRDGRSVVGRNLALDALKPGPDLNEAVVQGFQDASVNESFQHGAINAITGANDDVYLDTLLSLMPHAKSDDVCAHILQALSNRSWQSDLAVERVADTIKTIVESRGETPISVEVLHYLALIQRDSTESLLRELSLADPRAWVRRAALDACGEIGLGNPLVSKRMETVETAVLSEMDPIVKKTAVQELGVLIAIGGMPRKRADLRRELENFKGSVAAQNDPDLLRLITQLCDKHLQ